MLPSTANWDGQSDGPWTPLCVDPFRVHGFRDLKGYQTSLWGKHVVAPNILPHRQQDECMSELCQEVTKHMTRAGLQDEPRPARPTARSRRCSHCNSASRVHFPSARPQGTELVKWLQEDHWAGWAGSRSQCSYSRGRNRSGWYQTPPHDAQASASHPPLGPHNPILLMSSSATPWKMSTYKWDPANLGAGHVKMTSSHLLKRKQKGRNKLGLMWIRSWVAILHCLRPDHLPSGGHGWRVRGHS